MRLDTTALTVLQPAVVVPVVGPLVPAVILCSFRTEWFEVQAFRAFNLHDFGAAMALGCSQLERK